MKKHLFSIALMLSASLGLKAQSMPNGGFESWISTNYQEPAIWYNSNAQTLKDGGPANTTTVTGVSGMAVRMQTYIIGTDTFPAFIVNDNADIFNGKGGRPYSQQPTGITGFYRYNLPGQDTALLIVIFKKNSVVVSQDLFKIRGTGSQPAFTSFNYSLSLSVVPDTVMIASSCSNALDFIGVQNGSFMELDQLAFTGPGVTQPILNGDFENWSNATFDKLNNWDVSGDGIAKSTTAPYSGLANIQLTTINYGPGQVYGTSITSGQYSQSGPPKLGHPYTQMMDTLYGYYKFSGVVTDSADVYAQTKNAGTWVGGNSVHLSNAATWTQFKMPVYSMSMPDSIIVSMSSSKYPTVPGAAGTVFQVDNLYFKSQPLGINEADMATKGNVCYPNPANTVLNVLLSKPVVADGEVNVIDLAGKVVLKSSVQQGQDKVIINTSTLASGAYYFTIESGKEIITNKFLKE